MDGFEGTVILFDKLAEVSNPHQSYSGLLKIHQNIAVANSTEYSSKYS